MTSLYYWALGALALYAAARALFILKGRPAAAIAAALFLIASYAVHPALMVMGLTRPWGGAIHLVFLASGFAFTLAFFFTALLFLRDLCALVLCLWKKARRSGGCSLSFRERRSALLVPGILALVAFAGAAAGVWQAQKMPAVRKAEITLDRLPPELDGIRIVQLTDIHLSPLFAHDRFERIIEAAKALAPDFYVVTGDLADGTPEARAKDAALFGELPKTAPAFVIPGNHDYYTDFAAWRPFYEKIGVPLMQNEHRVLELRGLKVTVAGLTDRTGQTRGFPGPDIEKALAGAGPDALRIALIHRPESPDAQAEPRFGIDLQLSGHTHAAQLFFLRPFVAIQNRGNVYGLYESNGMPLYVGSGIGLWSGVPARLWAAPEIAEITLRSAALTK